MKLRIEVCETFEFINGRHLNNVFFAYNSNTALLSSVIKGCPKVTQSNTYSFWSFMKALQYWENTTTACGNKGSFESRFNNSRLVVGPLGRSLNCYSCIRWCSWRNISICFRCQFYYIVTWGYYISDHKCALGMKTGHLQQIFI